MIEDVTSGSWGLRLGALGPGLFLAAASGPCRGDRGRRPRRGTLLKMMKKYGTAAELPTEKKDWLGHKNIQNTTNYSKFSTGTRDARARKMFFSNRVV